MKRSVFTCAVFVWTIAIAAPGQAQLRWEPPPKFFERGHRQLENEVQILMNRGFQTGNNCQQNLLKIQISGNSGQFPKNSLEEEARPDLWLQFSKPQLNLQQKSR